MYKHLEDMLKKEKVSFLCCEVNVEPPNEGSTRFHKRIGFQVVKGKHQHEPGYVVDYMAKKLGKAPLPKF